MLFVSIRKNSPPLPRHCRTPRGIDIGSCSLFLAGSEGPEPLQDRVDGERKVEQKTGKKGLVGQVPGDQLLQGGERVGWYNSVHSR